MIIAVASGKGGTGKTTITSNLALSLEQEVYLVDCDVEEPNLNLFLQGEKIAEETAYALIPELKEELCSKCGVCADICEFNAIACANTFPLVFAELCHSCAGCIKLCPNQALKESKYPIGQINTYIKDKITLIEGKLNIGHPLAPPLIKKLKKKIPKQKTVIIDAPPGTSCPVVASLKGVDFALLVTEPTPFGLHDLDLALKTVKELKIPSAVIINKSSSQDNIITDYCKNVGVDVILKIPDNINIAKTYSKGKPFIEEFPVFKDKLKSVIKNIENRLGGIDVQ